MSTLPDSTSPIKDYIQSTLSQIKEGIPHDAKIDGIIQIEMSTIVQEEKGGSLNIRVVNFGANVSENQIQKITVPIRFLTDTDKLQEEAEKAKAEANKAEALMMKKAYSRATGNQ